MLKDGYALRLTRALKYTHWAETRYYDETGTANEGPHEVPLYAEVGLLSRNIIIQGSADSDAPNLFGATVFLHSEGDESLFADPTLTLTLTLTLNLTAVLHSEGDESLVARLSWVELRRAGQSFRVGRYPLHFHMIGNVRRSYVRYCSIHHTFNRAVTLHGINYLRIEYNVVFNVMGHALFIEDGIEHKNIFWYNLAILAKQSNALLNTDLTPALFWITNPDNTLVGNVAIGSQSYGFWYMAEPAGVVDLINFQGRIRSDELRHLGTCPSGEPILKFEKNKAASNSRYGLRVFANTGESLLGRERPCEPPSANNSYLPSVFKDFLAVRNKKVGAIFSGKVAKVKLQGFVVADNAVAGIEMPAAQGAGLFGEWGDNVIEDALVVGSMRFNRTFDIDQEPTWGVGISTPAYNRLMIRNVVFINFHCCFPAVGPMAKAKFQKHGGGYETRLEKISFIDSDFRVMWDWAHEGVMVRRARVDARIGAHIGARIEARLGPWHTTHTMDELMTPYLACLLASERR